MVRFQQKRPVSNFKPYFPYYKDPWTSYDPSDTSKCSEHKWDEIWEADEERDRLHRKNSYYYSREIDSSEDNEETHTLAIILFGSIIFCLFVPQIIDLLITVFCPGPLPPPPPPTPPPGPKCRKRLRLYHYAYETWKGRRRNPSIEGQFYYDPDNILNYISATRIQTLKDLKVGEDADDESEIQNDNAIHRNKKFRNSKNTAVQVGLGSERSMKSEAQL